MVDSISWSVNAVASSGAASKSSGKTSVDAVFSARVTVTPSATDHALALQLDNPAKIKFLAIVGSTDTLSVNTTAGSAATAISLAGPLVLHDAAIKLLGTNLGQIFVSNSSTDEAELSILIGYDLD